MDQLSRTQVLLYGATAVGVLLIGSQWVGAAADPGAGSGSSDSVSLSGPAGDLGGGPGKGAGSGSSATGPLISGEGQSVVVHVAGAVRNPGVYRMPGGSRVTDAVERAGGAKRSALLGGINLAAPLADGQQVVVPASGPAAAAPSGGAVEGPISLGSATVEQLEQIDGIGPVTAAAIVEFRDQNGGIASIDELDQISGIGPATIEAMRGDLQP